MIRFPAISPLNAVGRAVDRLVGVFNPQAEGQRLIQRHRLNSLRSATYAAAQSPRTIGDWSPVDQSVNRAIGDSAVAVRGRIRQLVRDFPYFSRAVNVMSDYVVGSGIIFQSRTTNASGHLNKKVIQQIEDTFNFWADEADVAGRLHLYEMMALAKRQDLECGEFLLVKVHTRDKGRYLPFALQMYEPDWLATGMTTSFNGKDVAIHEGVEYHVKTGQALAYHFTDPDGWGKTIRVEAADVIHGFKTLRPGQLRGISEFTPGVLVARDLSSYMDTEIDTAKLAAKYLAFVTTSDILGRQQSDTKVDPETGRRVDEIENAIIAYLRPDEKIDLAPAPGPGDNFPPMVKLILTMLAVSTGVPYELLSGNYEGMNYSTGKMVRVDFSQSLKPIAARHIRQFCEPVKRAFFDAAVLAGRLSFRDYFTNPAKYQRGEWQPPGMKSIDPAREAKSAIDMINAGLMSPQEVISGWGRDADDVLNETKAWQDAVKDKGVALNLGAISTALANNPAAIEQQQGGKKNA